MEGTRNAVRTLRRLTLLAVLAARSCPPPRARLTASTGATSSARFGSGTWTAQARRTWSRQAVRGGDRRRRRQDLLGELGPGEDPARTSTSRTRTTTVRRWRPCSTRPATTSAASRRPREQQDLLGQLQHRRDPAWEPGRQRRLDPVHGPGSAPSGLAIDPPRGGSTGPTSSQTRSVGNLDGRVPPRPCSAAAPTSPRSRTDRGRGRTRRRQDLLDRPRQRPVPGREPERHGRLDPVRRREQPGRAGDRPWGERDLLGQFRRRPDPDGEAGRTGPASTLFSGEFNSLFPALLRKPVSSEPPTIFPAERSAGAHLVRGRGPPTCSGVLFEFRPSRLSVEKDGSIIATGATPRPRGRRLHLHRDGQEPGRGDLADERCEEGQGLRGTFNSRPDRSRPPVPLTTALRPDTT